MIMEILAPAAKVCGSMMESGIANDRSWTYDH